MFRNKIKEILPLYLVYPVWNGYCQWRSQQAKSAFAQAPHEPQWLGERELKELDGRYLARPHHYTYDLPALQQRAHKQIATMLRYVPSPRGLHTFLDLGSWDGTCCQVLHQMGKLAVGIDIRTEGYTAEARHSGASLLQMDIKELAFPDNTFDFAFSFNSFEHFPNPRLALNEAIRVIRPGGYLYADFGPLWWSAKGAHQFEHIGIPFSQCLFPRDLFTQFAHQTGRQLTDYVWMNEWSIAQYRELWAEVSYQVDTIFYYEEYATEGLELIEQYPSCFKSKSNSFDDFQVSYIRALWRKR